MSSVLAIVSKALFEKMVPKNVKLGTVVDTDRYVSKNKTFDGLKQGGGLFLVTVRPPDEKLWLVAILENPKKKGDAWIAESNGVPLSDVTAAIPKLKFESGTGLKPKKGALGMSLQTPRALTEGDVKVLRGLVKGGKASGKVTASEAYREAVEEAVGGRKKQSSKKSNGGDGEGALRLERYRRPFEESIDDLEPYERKQLESLTKQEGASLADAFEQAEESEWGSMEVVDVVDAEDDVKYQFYLWPYGSGALFVNQTTKTVGNVCQHGFEGDLSRALVQELARAWEEGKKRLKIKEMVEFGDEEDFE